MLTRIDQAKTKTSSILEGAGYVWMREKECSKNSVTFFLLILSSYQEASVALLYMHSLQYSEKITMKFLHAPCSLYNLRHVLKSTTEPLPNHRVPFFRGCRSHPSITKYTHKSIVPASFVSYVDGVA